METDFPKFCDTYARLWPREILFWAKSGKSQGKRPEDMLPLLAGGGVYILYRGDVPYYIGRATKLWSRLWSHARPDARYGHLWTHFTAYAVNGPARGELEGILISAFPTSNSAKPRLRKTKLPRDFRRLLEAKMSLGAAKPEDFQDDEDNEMSDDE